MVRLRKTPFIGKREAARRQKAYEAKRREWRALFPKRTTDPATATYLAPPELQIELPGMGQ